MDGLHYFVFHIFDIGLRTPSIPTTADIDDEQKSITIKEDEFFDAKFAALRQRLNDKRENTKIFKRFGRQENNSKFSINIQNNHDDTVNVQQTKTIQQECGFTFLDSIFKYLQKMNIDNDAINNLKKFLELEQYDTEGVSMDVIDDNNGKNGNISKVIKDKQCIVAINKFISDTLGMLYVHIFLLFC